MDLERVAAAIRPRSHWEAMDLGFGLVRAWWMPLARLWLVTVLPLYLVIAIPLHAWPGWAILAFWWLRPLFDRLPLLVLSQGLFGALPPLRATLRTLPRLASAHLLPALTVYRFDPARSFNLPVWRLEGLRGRERWNRAVVLQRDGYGHAVWLTAACGLMEISFGIALFGLLAMAVPQLKLGELVERVFSSQEPSPWFGVALLAFHFIAFSIVEPLYVAAGFTLYLNRRIRLEGWDVELAFRRLARRLTGAARAGALAVILVAAAAAVFPGGAAWAAPAPRSPETAIRDVLAQPEFQTTKRVKAWRFRGQSRAAKPRARTFFGPALPSAVLPVLVLAAIAAGLGVLLYRGLKRLPATALPEAETVPARPVTSGVEKRAEPLPTDVPGTAWQLWEKGDRAGALGLLYRGAVAWFLGLERDPAKASWTEGDWLIHAAKRGPAERAEFFGTLTRAWQAAAYAHRPPAADEVQALCRSFPRHFGGAP